jgi:uncharacterized protein (TIGR03435 family)
MSKLWSLVISFPLWLSAADLTFDVASIKPSLGTGGREEGGKRDQITTSPGSLTMRNVTLNSCMKWAYGVQDYQISGPGWTAEERYDIAAKAEAPALDDQLKLMLQTLLAERFKLTFHRQSKEFSVLALTVAKGGPKFHESEGEGESSFQTGKASATAKRVAMPQFAEQLSGPLRMPVLDMTGLKGRYDFMVDLLPYAPERPDSPVDIIAIVITALQEQLGLKVESRKSPIEVLVVDRAERPSEN